MKISLTLTDALVLFIVATLATIVGNLVVAKIVSDQVSSQAGQSTLGKLLGSL